ncbi:MAG: transglutaminase family protein [Acidimicrobiales bacterium]|nr:transglutaminase family protein [Acidimicrobiales bacterium]
MRIAINHETTYSYDEPVPFALQEIRLTPRRSNNQSIARWNIDVEGGKQEVEFTDHHANQVQLISILPGHDQITVRSEGEVETSDSVGVTIASSGFAPPWLFLRSTALTRPGPGIDALVADLEPEAAGGRVHQMHELSQRISTGVRYETGRTNAMSTAEEAMVSGHGVCQDHAHIFVAAARSLDIPARYVSGYLVMDDRVDQEATHAWAEVWVDDLGWVGFDISNGISPDEKYVRVAVGLDYQEAAPISGVRFGSAAEEMSVSVQVQQQ